MATKYHARSVSLPSRSHPTTVKIEEELRKMKKWDSSSPCFSVSSSASVSTAVSALQDLYDSIDELLQMGSTQKILSCPKQRDLVEELLDASMKLLDICSIAKDMTFETQQHVGALHSAVRRRKGDSTIKNAIATYICFRKRMKKEAKKMVTLMKKMNETFNSSSLNQDQDQDHHLCSVIGALRQACLTNSSIFESLLLHLMPLTKPKVRGWSLVSKWMHRGAISCEEVNSNMNEFESVDAVLGSLCEGGAEAEKMKNAQRRFKALEAIAQEIEKNLDSVFRRMIKTRASLLNIISP